jgi:hypothetical protein
MSGYVFINGYGKVRFKATAELLTYGIGKQYKGQVKLPKQNSVDGCRWLDYNYYFTTKEITSS